MNDERGDWTYWSGWIATYALLGVFCFVVVFSGWFAPPYCAAEQSGALCLREWLGVIGSWTTIPAALLGVAFVSRQIRAADRNNSEAIEAASRDNASAVTAAARNHVQAIAINVLPQRSLAQRTRSAAIKLRTDGHLLLSEYKRPHLGVNLTNAREDLHQLLNHFRDAIFKEFEAQFGLPERPNIPPMSSLTWDHRELREKMDRAIDTFQEAEVNERPLSGEGIVNSVIVCTEDAIAYADGCIGIADNFLKFIDTITRDNRSALHIENAPSTAESSPSSSGSPRSSSTSFMA